MKMYANQKYALFLAKSYKTFCFNCGVEVLDPDKSSENQVIFNGICPSCGRYSRQPKLNKKGIKKIYQIVGEDRLNNLLNSNA